MYRMQQGAPDPTLVFLPILLATSASTLVGLLAVAAVQRLPLWSPVVLGYLLPLGLALAGFMAFLATLSAAALADRKSTRLNSSHGYISYAVFCLKKKKKTKPDQHSNI